MSKLLSLVLFSSLVACTTEDLSSSARAIIETPCASDSECPTGFECEIEVEHGVTTSYCQADDDSGACPAGYELEVEHGQAFCKPHGGSGGGSGSGGGGGGSGSGGVSSGATCTTDADCPATEECEIEVEHGATTGTCQLHGSI